MWRPGGDISAAFSATHLPGGGPQVRADSVHLRERYAAAKLKTESANFGVSGPLTLVTEDICSVADPYPVPS
jgi:hypothetical protein